VPLLDAFKAEQEALARVFPCTGAFDTHPQRMDGCVAQPFAPTLGRLTIARMLFNVRNQPRIADALPLACGVKATIEVERGASPVSTDLFRHLFQGAHSLGQEHHIRFMHRSHWDGSEHRAMIVDDGDDFLPL
jgi:hypothetical protein